MPNRTKGNPVVSLKFISVAIVILTAFISWGFVQSTALAVLQTKVEAQQAGMAEILTEVRMNRAEIRMVQEYLYTNIGRSP